MCPKHPKNSEHPKHPEHPKPADPRAPSPKQGTGSPARCPAPAEEAVCPQASTCHQAAMGWWWCRGQLRASRWAPAPPSQPGRAAPDPPWQALGSSWRGKAWGPAPGGSCRAWQRGLRHWERWGWDPRASPVSFQPPAAPPLPAPMCGMGHGAQGPPCEALVLPGAAAGAQGHVRAGTGGAGKRKAVRRVLGRGWRPGCRAGTPWQAAQSRLCARPALPAPLGNGTGLLSGAGWQPGRGPTAPRCPLPPSVSPPPCDGSPPHPGVHMLEPHPWAQMRHPASGWDGWDAGWSPAPGGHSRPITPPLRVPVRIGDCTHPLAPGPARGVVQWSWGPPGSVCGSAQD